MKSICSWLVVPLLALGCTASEKTPEPVVAPEPPKPVARALPTNLPEAVASEFRNPENRARDTYRHPLETLQFFGLQPQMRVIEVSPGGGWYSEILAPFLTPQGEFLAAVPVPGDSEYLQKSEAKYKEWIQANPELKVTVIPFSNAPFSEVESVDMVLTFRNVHNWMNAGTTQAVFQNFYKALKPGGILGVVEHRENAKKKQDPKGKSGYVKESEVIRFATKAGFKLDAKSEINANPKDTKNYPEGVWTLPPSLAKGDVDRAKYLEIGESDRMTLRFVKPAPKASKNTKPAKAAKPVEEKAPTP